MLRQGSATLAAALTACAVAAPAPAIAHGSASAPRGEARLRAFERATLGDAHAAEHARERRALRREAARLRRMGPARRKALRQRARRAFATARAAAAEAPANEVGRWENATIPFPAYAINVVVLPTGKIAFWGRAGIDDAATGHRANVSDAYVWNPAAPDPTSAAAFTPIPPPVIDIDLDGDGDMDRAPIFCSGQSLLPSGEVLAAGGNLEYPNSQHFDYAGLDRVFTFDPWSNEWTEQDRMAHGRWYPGQVELPDGRTVVLAGLDEQGTGGWNLGLETYSPAATRGGRGAIEQHTAGRLVIGPYPHMFTLPGGKVLAAGEGVDADYGKRARAALLDPARLGDAAAGSAWTPLPSLANWGKASQAALLPGGTSGSSRVTVLGGYAEKKSSQIVATNRAQTLDAAQPSPAWTSAIPNLNEARAYGNLVVLPDGSLVSVGGGKGDAYDGSGQNYTGNDQELKRVELLRPGVDSAWRLGPPQKKWRSYHSTAVLLPDGRVLSAGDDYWNMQDQPDPMAKPSGATVDRAEIYSPPYLFADDGSPAPRPVIGSVPSTDPATGGVRWGETFGVGVSGREASRAVLVAPAATTHGDNMSQRSVELDITARFPGRGINVRAPGTTAIAPPGWYMLFVLDAQGTPSVARWVWLNADRASVPPVLVPQPDPLPTPTPATPGPGPGSQPAEPATRLRVRTKVRGLTPGMRGLRVRVGLNRAGRVRVAATLGGRQLSSRRLAVAGAERTATLRVPATTRRKLRAGRVLWLRLRIEATTDDGKRATRWISRKIRRPGR